MKGKHVCLGLCVLAAALAGCERSSGDPVAAAPATQVGQPGSWLLTEMPDNAIGVTEAKAIAVEGEQVVLLGRIGGGKTPLTDGSPVFTLVDLALPSCAENPEDKCRTPWDYCCEPRDVLTANMATVQVVDAEGNPVTADLAAVLSPLDTVVVVGTVSARPNAGVLTVRATGIHRTGG